MATLDVQRLYQQPADQFRSILLELDYQEILTVLRAMPPRVKDLNEGFWRQKGMRDTGIETYSREEYVEYMTYNRDVVEGSQDYLDVSLCAMRAALFKDRYLIQYFLDRGADPSFVYYGLISHENRGDVQDIIDVVEPHTKKEGYYYNFCRGLSAKYNEGKIPLGLTKLVIGQMSDLSTKGLSRGLRAGNNPLISVGSQYWANYTGIDLSYLRDPDATIASVASKAPEAKILLPDAIFYSKLAKNGPNSYPDAKFIEQIIIGYEYLDTDAIGFCLAKSLMPEKKDWLLQIFDEMVNEGKGGQLEGMNYRESIEDAWFFGLFALGYYQDYTIGEYHFRYTETDPTLELFILGYKKPIKRFYDMLRIHKPSNRYEWKTGYRNVPSHILNELGLTDVLSYVNPPMGI